MLLAKIAHGEPCTVVPRLNDDEVESFGNDAEEICAMSPMLA